MTYEERQEAFRKELLLLGEKYQIALTGTCEYEGIYGEIMFVDLQNKDSTGWRDIEENLWNFAS